MHHGYYGTPPARTVPAVMMSNCRAFSASTFAVTGLGYVLPWSVNAGFIAGKDRTLIVDTGSNFLSATTICGFARCARPDSILSVINTEKHFDHIGGNSYFSAQGIEISGHAGIERTHDEFQAEIRECNDLIADGVRRAQGEAAVFFSGTELKMPDTAITQDFRLELGECQVEVLLTPGHPATYLSVWAIADRVLFCGDWMSPTATYRISTPGDRRLENVDGFPRFACRHRRNLATRP